MTTTPPDQQPRKALATIGTGPMEPVLALSSRTFRSYGSRHGYVVAVGDGAAAGRPTSWGKVLLLRRLLDEYDEVLWIDSDALVLDEEFDVRDRVDPSAFQAFARPVNVDGVRMLNAGIWFIRGDRGKAFLDLVWAQDQWTLHPWWEQRAVLQLLGFDESGAQIAASEWLDGTDWLPDEWNSIEDQGGLVPCRIRHYAGRSNEFRLGRMAIDLLILDGRWNAWWVDLRWRRGHQRYRKQRMMQHSSLRAMARTVMHARNGLKTTLRIAKGRRR